MRQPIVDAPPDRERVVELAELERLTAGSSYADAVHRLLTVARTQLRMQVAWVSEFVGSEQVLRFDAEPGADAPSEGTCPPLGGSFCARVLDGRFPRLIPGARGVPDAALLDVTAQLHIGAYVGVPPIARTAQRSACCAPSTARPARRSTSATCAPCSCSRRCCTTCSSGPCRSRRRRPSAPTCRRR